MQENNESASFARKTKIRGVVYFTASHFASSGLLGDMLKQIAMEALLEKEAACESSDNTMSAYMSV